MTTKENSSGGGDSSDDELAPAPMGGTMTEECRKSLKRMSIMQEKSDNIVSELTQSFGKRGDDRNAKLQALHGHSTLLADRMEVTTHVATRSYTALKGQLELFKKDIADEVIQRRRLADDVGRELAAHRKTWEASLEAEQTNRMGTEMGILRAFDDKTSAVMRELRQSRTGSDKNEATLRRYLEVDVPRLYESLREETASREAMEGHMMSVAMQEVAELQELIGTEKKAREDSEEAMLRMMEDVVEKMHVDIAAERKERILAQEMLQSLLKEACSKLENSSA